MLDVVKLYNLVYTGIVWFMGRDNLFFLFFVLAAGSPYIALADLKCVILLPQPLKLLGLQTWATTCG